MTLGFDDMECRLAYSFLLLLPGIPFIYYGDEIGIQYFRMKSVEGGYDRTGSRTPMQWNKDKNLGFSQAEKGKLYLPVDGRDGAPTVEEQEKEPKSLLNTVRKVLALRHASPGLQAEPNFEVVYAEKDCFPFVFRRGSFQIAVNPSSRSAAAAVGGTGKAVFQIGNCSLKDGTLQMGGQSFAVFTEVKN